jgi:hypothetical protein
MEQSRNSFAREAAAAAAGEPSATFFNHSLSFPTRRRCGSPSRPCGACEQEEENRRRDLCFIGVK